MIIWLLELHDVNASLRRYSVDLGDERRCAITPSGGTSAPTVGVSDARLEPNVTNSVIVTYDEAVSETGGIALANYTIADNTTTAAAFDTPRTARITFQDAPVLADNLDIAVAAATDLAGNPAAGVATVSIAAADGTVPTLDMVAAEANAAALPTIPLGQSQPRRPALLPECWPVLWWARSGGTLRGADGTTRYRCYETRLAHSDSQAALTIQASLHRCSRHRKA